MRVKFEPSLLLHLGTAGLSLREEGVNVGLSVSESCWNCQTRPPIDLMSGKVCRE